MLNCIHKESTFQIVVKSLQTITNLPKYITSDLEALIQRTDQTLY